MKVDLSVEQNMRGSNACTHLHPADSWRRHRIYRFEKGHPTEHHQENDVSIEKTETWPLLLTLFKKQINMEQRPQWKPKILELLKCNTLETLTDTATVDDGQEMTQKTQGESVRLENQDHLK